MTAIHNFSAGPAILPKEAIEESIEALKNFAGTGLSLLEVSHRGKEFVEVMDQACKLVKDLMKLGDDYDVIYLQGGASLQFLMVAMNCLERKAGYLDTGTWAANAIREARLLGEIHVLGSSKESGYDHIPREYTISNDLDYFHCTSNNTIYGTQMHTFPDCPVPMICDMSSDIFSRQLDFTRFDLIYAGAQKNMGPAGATLVIIKKGLLGRVSRMLPTMMDYRTHISKESMFNTPPVFPVFVVWRTLIWMKNRGLERIEADNEAKAGLLYDEIDRNERFRGIARAEDRSKMNATFDLVDPDMSAGFLDACKEAGISGIKGHRSVGGFRASMYNALSLESVQVLVNVMRHFKA